MKHGLKGFKFQTDNGVFNSKVCKNLVATHGGKLITNCLNSLETMPTIKRSWRPIGEMAAVMQLHCGIAEHFCKRRPWIFIKEYPRQKINRTGQRQSPFEKMHGEIPSFDDLR